MSPISRTPTGTEATARRGAEVRRRTQRGRGLRGSLAVVALFCVMGVVAAIVVANTLTDPYSGSTTRYSAVFDTAEGLGAGDEVTAAGVRVGTVESIDRAGRPDGTARAVVGLTVSDDVDLDGEVAASIRYGDMLGVRYLALTAPLHPSGRRLQPGERIPQRRTSGPIDLTAIFDGFKPLFDALDPGRVNRLARSVVAAFGGNESAIRTLLARVAEVTGDLNDHQDEISGVVGRLAALASSMDQRSARLTELIDGLRALGGTLAQNNDRLISVLDHGSAAARRSARVLAGRAGTLSKVVLRMQEMTGSWTDNTGEFDRTMDLLPQLAEGVNRIGDYGSWLQLYTCTLTAKAGDAEANLLGTKHSKVCR